MPKPIEIAWRRQARQIQFLAACGLAHPFAGGGPQPPVADAILYGGAAGGGKSDALLIAGLIACLSYPGAKVGYFRRTYPQLEGPGGAIMRSRELYAKVGQYNSTQHRWAMPGGGVVQFCHCEREANVYDYQSQQFDVLLLDEATQFTRFQVRYLLTRNRATVPGITPFCAMATNPGGVGHGWAKKEFIDTGMPGEAFSCEVEPGQFERHLFIPARLDDNKVLEERDPRYRQMLQNQPEAIRRALLDGDWAVFAGQYFTEWRTDKHVVEPFAIPDHWRRFASIDWGYSAPCCVLWHAVDPSDRRVITYRELYVSRVKSSDVAAKVKELTGGEKLAYMVGSPDMWQERGLSRDAREGEDVADDFIRARIALQPADNRRVIGWLRMREYLADAPDGKPWWQVFNVCRNLIRTLPELVHDDHDVEDVDDACEDHAPEAARYALMSRPAVGKQAIFLPGESGKRRRRDPDGWPDEEDDDGRPRKTFFSA